MDKTLKINIPEGYEIDKEKSTFEEIVFKPITEIDYYTIAIKLFNNKINTYFISNNGNIYVNNGIPTPYDCSDKNIALSSRQLEKILAINQLFNISAYYNKNRLEERKYIIKYNTFVHEYYVQELGMMESFGLPVFYYYDDAKSVIHNPNFRSILDSIYE